jgi:Domain of unknown function (DUF4149)
MQRTLRILGTVNAGVWFGSGLFLTAVVGPTFFSPAVTELVGRQNAGLIAQAILAKYFVLQLVCVAAAIGLLVARVRTWRCRHLGWLAAIAAIVVTGGFWLQPKLIELNRTRYATTSPEQKEVVAKEFGKWHGISQAGNIVVLAGALAHLLVFAQRPKGAAEEA